VTAEIVERLVDRVIAAAGVPPTPPVDITRVAAYLGVAAIHEVDMVEDGRLEQEAGRSCIFIRAGSARSRQLFTIAHELGHIVLAGRETQLIAHRSHTTADPEERFCNQFAAALLMPQPWLMNTAASRRESISTARAVSRATGTSLAATVVRLRDVIGWSSSLLQWRRLDGTWRLSTTVGLPRRAHNRINSTPHTRAALDAATGDVVLRVTLPLAIDGVPSMVRGELLVRQRSAVLLGSVL
jgi:hypothetical protein